MKKLLLLLVLVTAVAQAQTGAPTVNALGKSLYNSFKTNLPAEVSKYYPTLAELKIIKDANNSKDDSTILKFLAQTTLKNLTDEWTATKNKLEVNGVVWNKAGTPAVSYEPYMGDNKRECAIVQVMFSADGKQHVASAKCTQVKGLWYIVEDIKPNAQEVK